MDHRSVWDTEHCVLYLSVWLDMQRLQACLTRTQGLFCGLTGWPKIRPTCVPHHVAPSHLDNTSTDVLELLVWSFGCCAVNAIFLIRYSVWLMLPSWNHPILENFTFKTLKKISSPSLSLSVFVNAHACACVCHMSAGASGGQKGVLDSLGLASRWLWTAWCGW